MGLDGVGGERSRDPEGPREGASSTSKVQARERGMQMCTSSASPSYRVGEHGRTVPVVTGDDS